jgi:predicted small integral membrane protein
MIEGMVVWVRAQAAGMPNDQRARVERVDGKKLYVVFLGNDSRGIVFPNELCGLQITNNLTVKFTVTETQTKVP